MPSISRTSLSWGILVLVVALIVAGVIVQTPHTIPVGFPFVAKTTSSEHLVRKIEASPVKFADRTLDSGLFFLHQQGDEQLAGLDESLGSGACAADFNNDGWIDLFLVNGSGHTRYYGKAYWWQVSQGNTLFINQSGQRFNNATADSGLDKTIWGMGCLTADFDNDGDSDLFVTGKEGNLLYRNEGQARFTDVTPDSGFHGEFWATSAAVADFDGDGFLDLYVGNFIAFNKGTKTFEANSQFMGEKRNTFDASLYRAQANTLYRNVGGLKFDDVTAKAEVFDADGRTLDVAWQDLNQDGLPDLLVTNGRGTGSNTAYLNKGKGRFEPGGQALGLRSALGNRGIASGDLDNDGDTDLVIASPMGENTIALIQQQSAQGSTYFKDQAREMGIGADQFLYRSGWSPMLRDFNNDGQTDVFIASGHLEPDPDAAKVPQGQPKQLLLNRGASFEDVTSAAGKGLLDVQSARGIVAADFDNDGDTDLYVSHNNDPGQYLVNESAPQHWLGLKLVGKRSNRDAVGAKVDLVAGESRQTLEVTSGEGFLSDSDRRLIFGLGSQDRIDRLSVKWPSGKQQTINPPAINRYWVIEEGKDQPQEMSGVTAVAVPKQLKLKMGADQRQIRADYIDWLSRTEPDTEAWQEIAVALDDNDAVVRRAAIAAAVRYKSPQGLSVLVRALEDAEAENVVSAIAGLKTYEDETSIRGLLRLFSHEAAEVKMALADCFALFFREEEAVVQRKYLAVPYFIRLLDDPVPEVRAAAASALADAEHYRGLHSLQAHLHDPDDKVRAAIVRSLGLIRQVQSRPELQSLLHDDHQSPQVIAQALIALKRLNDEQAESLLGSYLLQQGEFHGLALEKRLQVLEHVLAQQVDGAIFDAGQLRNIIRSAFENAVQTLNAKPELALLWISIWQKMPDELGERWLDQQTHSSRADLRLAAFQALIANYPQRYIDAAWSDPDPNIKLWVLPKRLSDPDPLSANDYATIVNQPELNQAALQIWNNQGLHAFPQKLMDVLLGEMSKHQAVTGIGKNDHPSIPQTMDRIAGLQAVCTESDQSVQAFCPLMLFSEKSAVHRELAARILQDAGFPLAVREQVLKHYSVDFDPDAVNVLYSLTQSKKEPLRKAVLNQLLAVETDALIDLADKLANNAAEDADIRYRAVDFLLRRGRSQAREILYR